MVKVFVLHSLLLNFTRFVSSHVLERDGIVQRPIKISYLKNKTHKKIKKKKVKKVAIVRKRGARDDGEAAALRPSRWWQENNCAMIIHVKTKGVGPTAGDVAVRISNREHLMMDDWYLIVCSFSAIGRLWEAHLLPCLHATAFPPLLNCSSSFLFWLKKKKIHFKKGLKFPIHTWDISYFLSKSSITNFIFYFYFVEKICSGNVFVVYSLNILSKYTPIF